MMEAPMQNHGLPVATDAATTDAELLLAARTDAAAFREVYERHAAVVHSFHLRRSGDRDAAYDLTAETFAQAWLSRFRFRDEAGGSARPWLMAIARNVLVSSVRRQALERSACERLGLEARLDRKEPEAEPGERWLDGLDDALDELPANQRDAIRLRVVDDLSYDDVADVLGTSAEAARVRVHRGLASLRNRFANRPEASK
jgi:RNA polymerase sigma-70 factor (ECF subfamily)